MLRKRNSRRWKRNLWILPLLFPFLCLCGGNIRGQNLVSNPSFEVDEDGDRIPDGWRRYAHKLPEEALKALSMDSEIAYQGEKCVKISVSNLEDMRSLCWVTPRFSVEPGKWLVATVWVKAEDFSGRSNFLYWFGTKDGKRLTQMGGPIHPAPGDKWRRQRLLLEVPPDAYVASLDLGGGIRNGTIWFDDLTVEQLGGEDILPSAMHKFDFGPEDSKGFIGFRKVAGKDPHSSKKGYGWAGNRSDIARIYRDWRRLEGKIPDWAPINPDPLTYDFVHAREATFEMDIAMGDYEVILLCGDIGIGRGDVVCGVKTGYSIAAEGTTVVNVPGLDEESFRRDWLWQYADDEWRPDYDVWDRYIAPRFTTHRFSAKVTDGKLTLAFQNCPVNMLAVYRSQDGNNIDGELKRLDEMRQMFFPFQEFEYGDPRPMPELTNEERKKGYLIFVKHYLDPVFPYTVPQREEITSEMKLSAAANEYEPATFVVHALDDIAALTVQATDLVNETGSKISRDDVAIRFVRYIEIVQARPKLFKVCPHLLVKRKAVDIPKGTNKWVWLTVHVPKGAEPGAYRGTVHVQAQGRPPTNLKLTLNVLPFELPDRIKDRYYCILCNWPSSSVVGDVWEEYTKRFPDLKAHGFETLYIAGAPFRPTVELKDGEVHILEMDFLARTMDLYRKTNFTENRVLWNTAFDLRRLAKELTEGNEQLYKRVYTQLLQMIDKHARQEGWPQIFYMNNSSDWSTVEEQLPRTTLVKDAGVTVWDQQGQVPTIKAVAPLCDLLVMGRPKDDETVLLLEQIKQSGREVGFHNMGLRLLFSSLSYAGTDAHLLPGAYRFFYGFWFWRTGAQVQGNEFYTIWFAQPYNPFDGVFTEPALGDAVGVAMPGPDGPRPAIHFEWMREGRDDFRYVALLEQLVAQARKSGTEEAAQCVKRAQELLTEIRNAISVDVTGYPIWYGIYGQPPSKTYWPPSEYDRYRSEIAKLIIELKQ